MTFCIVTCMTLIGLGISSALVDFGYKVQYKALLYGKHGAFKGLCELHSFDPCEVSKQVFKFAASVRKGAAESTESTAIAKVKAFLKMKIHP